MLSLMTFLAFAARALLVKCVRHCKFRGLSPKFFDLYLQVTSAFALIGRLAGLWRSSRMVSTLIIYTFVGASVNFIQTFHKMHAAGGSNSHRKLKGRPIGWFGPRQMNEVPC
jgi:hypothetical protein